MMEIIVPHDVAPLGPVTPHLKSTDVVGFQAYVVELVELDNVFVPAQLDGIVRSVVKKIVPHNVPHAAEAHP